MLTSRSSPPSQGTRSVKRRSRLLPRPALPFLALLPLACGGEAPAGPTFSVRDSAGVVIAENRGELAPGAGGWAVSPEPTLSVGAAAGDEAYLLFRTWGAARLSDGRIAVANNGSPDLRVFGATGEHQRTFGARGEGPGEFDSPVLVGVLPGDTLVVVDRTLRRLYLFHPDAGFVRGATADPAIEGYLLTAGMFSSGSVVVWRSEWGVEMPNGFYRFPRQYRSVTLDGQVGADLGSLPGDETLMRSQAVEGGSMTMGGGSPFGRVAAVAVRGDRFFYGSQDRWEIRVHDQSGALVRLIRRDKAPTPVTQDHVAAFMEEAAAGAEDGGQGQEFRRMLREAPIPELHPAHGSIHADALGCLWVEEYRLPGDTTRVATVLDPEGRMTGSVALPPGLAIFEIGADYLLGRWADELGVEYLRLYALTRPPGD